MVGALNQLWQPPTAGGMERSARHQVAPVVARLPLDEWSQGLQPAPTASYHWLLRTPLRSGSAHSPTHLLATSPPAKPQPACLWGLSARMWSVPFY